MALTVGPLITAARDRSPAFHKSRVPDGVLARALSNYQRELISRLADIDPSLVAQQASIAFAISPENAIGVVGAGTAGGLPGELSGAGLPQALIEPAGPLVEINTEDAAVLYPETPVSAATVNTLTKTAAGWTVNTFAGKIVEITAGPGARQRREIASNTATVLTLVAGTTFETLPTVESLFRILAPLLQVTKNMGVVVELAPTGVRQGYLVRLNAAGVPYIDVGKPLVARFDEGIELPPHETIIGGTIRYTGTTSGLDELEIRPYRARMSKGYRFTSWLEGGSLFLGGMQDLWKDVDSIDLRYVPVAPELTALTDLLLLPDYASPALVAQLALTAGERVNGLPDMPKIDLQALYASLERAQQTFLNSVGRQARNVEQFVEDVWP